MKKIIFAMVLVISLTGCGKKNINENALSEAIETGVTVTDVGDGAEGTNVEKNLEDEENRVVEIIEENPKDENKKIENNTAPVTETDDKDKMPEVISDEEKIVYEEGVEIGKRALDFEVELLSGEKVKLSEYFGKPIFLNFWATWCGPCVGEMPDIEKIKSEYGDKVVVLAVNGGELKEDVKAFIDMKKYTFNVGLDQAGDILTKYDSMYIPLSVFIDKDGIIQERQVGALSEVKMKEIIEKLI